MTNAALLEQLRPRAFGVAYRMLGSVADAEDIAQEALLRVHRALSGGERIASPLAYVATIAARLALDELRSARVRRETYVGTWLPEPLLTGGEAPPADMADSLSTAFLVLLESLSPDQRAAFLLRDVFDYEYSEIADVVGTSEANARQLAARARRRVKEGKARFQPTREQRAALAQRFFAAAREGDVGELEALLAEDVVLSGDGGGRVPAIQRPLHGRTRVASTLHTWYRHGIRTGGAILREVEVNGVPGALLLDRQQRVLGVMTLGFAGLQIAAVMSVVNPDKLAHLGTTGDLPALARRL